MDRLLNVMALFSLALLALVLVSVRRAHIRVEYSVSWLSAAIILLVLSRNYSLLQWASSKMGIDYPPLALLLLVFCLFLVVFYQFSIRISDLKDANVALTQRLAILEFQLRTLQEERGDEELHPTEK